MGWLGFGRESAPADVRPFAPAWLDKAIGEEGFACSGRYLDWRNLRALSRNPDWNHLDRN